MIRILCRLLGRIPIDDMALLRHGGMWKLFTAYNGYSVINAAITGGADVSVTARMDPAVKPAIATIGDNAWEDIEYTDAIDDEPTKTWILNVEVAEVAFTTFRLIGPAVRRNLLPSDQPADIGTTRTTKENTPGRQARG